MCTFITLIAATEDEDAINAVLASFDTCIHKRRAARADTPRVTAALAGGEKEYLLTRGQCDCGPYLGHAEHAVAGANAADAAEIVHLRHLG